MEPLVIFENASVARADGTVVLRSLSWTMRDEEAWAVVGPMGSGKSTVAEAVLGKHRIVEGAVTWPLVERLRRDGRPVAYPSDVMRLVSFKEESRLFSYSNRYYQQRFEFSDTDDPVALGRFLRAGSDAGEEEVAEIVRRLGLAELAEQTVNKLSNGQMRRARVARALLARPEILILDDPFVGLDVAGRGELERLLGELVAHGQNVLLVVGDDAVPGWITHVLKLEGEPWNRGREPLGVEHHPPAHAGGSTAIRVSSLSAPTGRRERNETEPVIELRHVSVAHGGTPILTDVSWRVRVGERWAVVGPNGAGKSTLLSLICGDHPQAYANDVRVFGQHRGSGESIWDVKRRIGLVSPEFHFHFHGPLNAYEVAVTGFHDVLAARKATPEQAAAVNELFEELEIAHLADRLFTRLSTGEQRLILVARALVKRPPLLILDEPFQGFSPETVERIRGWLDRELEPDQTLLFVSHRPDEMPRSITHRLELSAGRVV